MDYIYNNENTKDKEITYEEIQLYYDTLTRKQKLEYKKKIDHLTFTNEVVFPMVMKNKEYCMEVLSLLLGKKVTQIGNVEVEKTYKTLLGKRGIRLDVYVEDNKARYNIEIQVAPYKNAPHRVRYYQSLMDADIIKEGVFYDKLKKTYIIFICMFDPFDLGLPVYTVRQSFEENLKYKYDDGTSKIFFNATAHSKMENEKIRQFLEYCFTAIPTNELTEKIHINVEDLKNNESLRKDVMTFELRDAIIKNEEFNKGKLDEKIKIAKKLLDLNLKLEDIIDSTGLSKDEILKLKKEI